MLTGLKDRLDQNTGNKTAFAYFGGHGNTAMVKADTVPNPVIGQVAQGRVMSPGDATTSLPLTQDFVSRLLAVSVTPEPDLTRMINAGITLTTFTEGYSGPLVVLLDGLQIGVVSMSGALTGASYQVDIPDSAMQQLAAAHAFDSLTADISFGFLNGTPASSFRLATEWDFEAGAASFYGVGLAGPSVMVIPAPGAGLVALTAPFMLRRRRRSTGR
jgi:hypothetical protein